MLCDAPSVKPSASLTCSSTQSFIYCNLNLICSQLTRKSEDQIKLYNLCQFNKKFQTKLMKKLFGKILNFLS